MLFGHNNTISRAIAFSSTLAVGMVVTLPSTALARFNDVDSSYWANEYVQALSDMSVINGFPDGTFQPEAQVTRAQFATIVDAAFNQSAVREPISFSDVPANHWAAGAISRAYTKGFLSGYPDGTFGLNQPITRLEAMVALTSGLGIDTSGANAELLDAYADKGEIPDWAVRAIATATGDELVVNYPNVNQLNPNRNASRAEIAAIAYQALVHSGQAQAIASEYVPTVAVQTGSSETEQTTETPVSNTDDFSELVASLASNDTDTRKAAADQLAGKGAEAVPELADALESDKAETRAAAAYALNEIGADAAPAAQSLIDVLKDDDEIVRALATSTLAQVGLDQSVLINIMTAAIQSETGLVKDIAADALVGIGSDAVPALGEVLKNDAANDLAKRTAATLIGDISQVDQVGDDALRSAVPILAELLEDGDSNVRKAAAEALGDFGPLADAAIPALSRAILVNDSEVNRTLANSLKRIGQQSTPGLTEALNSDDLVTRLYAADALWTLTKDTGLILPTIVSVLSEGDVESQELAALALTYLGREAAPALPDLRGLLGSNNDRIVNIVQLSLLILNNNNAAAPDLGFLRTDAEKTDSIPAIVEVVSQLWD